VSEWRKVDDSAQDGRWILAYFTGELSDSQSPFAVTRFYSSEWRSDEGDRCLATPDFWIPLPEPPK